MYSDLPLLTFGRRSALKVRWSSGVIGISRPKLILKPLVDPATSIRLLRVRFLPARLSTSTINSAAAWP